jgi:fido (protein-threonine AMPylation protein)
MDICTCSFNFLKTLHTKYHDKFYKLAGISREQVWIQGSSPGSSAPALGVITIETENPMKEFATSNHPWVVKFREYAKKAFRYRFLRCSIFTQ